MGHEYKRDAQLPLQSLQLHLHGPAQLVVKRRQRLIQQQELRTFDHGTGNGYPLLLATRKLMRLAAGKILQLHHRKDIVHALTNFGPGPLLHLQAIGDVFVHRHMGKQRVVLEHGIQRAMLWGGMGNVMARQANYPGVWLLKTRHQAQQGGFAATRRPQKGDELAVQDVQVQRVQHGFVIERLGDVLQGEKALVHSPETLFR